METKKTALFILCVMLLSLGFQSCKPDDTKLQKEVSALLNTIDQNISSSVQDGTVTLSGTVESAEISTNAEEIAKSVRGIKSVVNNIQVKADEPTVAINPDEVILTAVTSKLNEANLSGINVEVADGEVILTGNVKRSDLTKVLQLANESNPKKVTNKLNIK